MSVGRWIANGDGIELILGSLFVCLSVRHMNEDAYSAETRSKSKKRFYDTSATPYLQLRMSQATSPQASTIQTTHSLSSYPVSIYTINRVSTLYCRL
jgi:hypothetical protein